MVQEILLTGWRSNGLVTLVDDWNYDWLSEFVWNYGGDYARTNVPIVPLVEGGRRQRTVLMHRMIWERRHGQISLDREIDHENLNKLDNREENLRLADDSRQGQNVGRRGVGSSQFKGVSWHVKTQKWSASIRVRLRQHHLGVHSEEYVAALAYDEAVRRYCDPRFARYNFPRVGEKGWWEEL